LGFDVIGETLRATNLGDIKEGSIVNYERSAKVGDEIGGHNVSGHVCSTVGRFKKAAVQTSAYTLSLRADMAIMQSKWRDDTLSVLRRAGKDRGNREIRE
jgi:riboflavin synthase alpha subunit